MAELKSAIDFSSWTLANFPGADAIAEQRCKVPKKLLLLFILHCEQLAGIYFVSSRQKILTFLLKFNLCYRE